MVVQLNPHDRVGERLLAARVVCLLILPAGQSPRQQALGGKVEGAAESR